MISWEGADTRTGPRSEAKHTNQRRKNKIRVLYKYKLKLEIPKRVAPIVF